MAQNKEISSVRDLLTEEELKRVRASLQTVAHPKDNLLTCIVDVPTDLSGAFLRVNHLFYGWDTTEVLVDLKDGWVRHVYRRHLPQSVAEVRHASE